MPPKKQAKKKEGNNPAVEIKKLEDYTDQELLAHIKKRELAQKLPNAEAQCEIFNTVMPELEKIVKLEFRSYGPKKEAFLLRDLRTYHKLLQQEIEELKSEAQ